MNYRHSYHAGNFADVVKHVILIELIHALKQKEKPFCYIDAHAGEGLYTLPSQRHTSEETKPPEYLNGVYKLWQESACHHASHPLANYLTLIKQYNRKERLEYYPGSPLIAKTLLRPQDHLIAIECRLESCALLKKHLPPSKQLSLYHQDGHQYLKALLPPKERRGLVLLDPPFENPKEFTIALATLTDAYRRFASGVYALWYPIKDRAGIDKFWRNLQSTRIPKILAVELCVYPDDNRIGLNGCGMVLVNPPWKLGEQCHTLLNTLLPYLRQSNLGGKVTLEQIS